jgi:hemoglobin-like flavoprotein
LPEIRHELRDLGKRHAEYGVSVAFMGPMREALIMMLRELLGDKLTPKAEVAWRNVYTVIENYIVEGLES